jgi:hypothetical protein
MGAISIQWHPLAHAFWKGVFSGTFKPIRFGVSSFILADFSAGGHFFPRR